MKHID